MTFKQFYELEKSRPTPAQSFINEICEITGRREITVRLWLSGTQVPDYKTLVTLSEHFKTPIDELFAHNSNDHDEH